jgi:hypothetical protein
MPFQPNELRPSGNYAAYLVRMWQDSDQEPWRASAQSAQSGEIVLFASLAELFAFLKAQTVVRSSDDIDQ